MLHLGPKVDPNPGKYLLSKRWPAGQKMGALAAAGRFLLDIYA